MKILFYFQRYVINGEISEISDSKLEITELPVRTWTQTYKEQVTLNPPYNGLVSVTQLLCYSGFQNPPVSYNISFSINTRMQPFLGVLH